MARMYHGRVRTRQEVGLAVGLMIGNHVSRERAVAQVCRKWCLRGAGSWREHLNVFDDRVGGVDISTDVNVVK